MNDYPHALFYELEFVLTSVRRSLKLRPPLDKAVARVCQESPFEGIAGRSGTDVETVRELMFAGSEVL